MDRRQQIIVCLMTILFILSSCQIGSKDRLKTGVISDIPELVVTIGEKSATLDHGHYSIEKRKGVSMTVETTDVASPYQLAEQLTPIHVKSDKQVQIDVEGDPELNVYECDYSGAISEITVSEQSFTLPGKDGTLILEVFAEWKNAEASYTFVVDINDE